MTDSGHIEELRRLGEEVAQLRDLFTRRLLEDKAKTRLYDELYSQLAEARGALARQAVIPLVTELLLVLDRLQAAPADPFRDSVLAELTEVLLRQGVETVRAEGQFDAAIHDAVATVESTDLPVGVVASLQRHGYSLGPILLRPARVTVVAVPIDREVQLAGAEVAE